MRRYLVHLIVAGLLLGATGSAEASGKGAGAGGQPPTVETCENVRALIEARSEPLQAWIVSRDAEFDTAQGAERAEIKQQLVALRARENLLEVALRRIDRGRLTEKECMRIEAFLLRFISPS